MWNKFLANASVYIMLSLFPPSDHYCRSSTLSYPLSRSYSNCHLR